MLVLMKFFPNRFGGYRDQIEVGKPKVHVIRQQP